MNESQSSDATPVGSPPSPPRRLEMHIGALVLMALVAITLVNEVVRYFTDQSFAWTEEFSVFLLVVLTLAGAAAAAARDSHIRIDFFYERARPSVRKALIALSMVATVAMFLLLAVLLVRTGWQEYQFEETTTGLGVPRWWYTAWLAPLALFVAVRALRAGLCHLRQPSHTTGATAEGDRP